MPSSCLLLAADKDDGPVQVVQTERGGDGNFATVAFTMVSTLAMIPILPSLMSVLQVYAPMCSCTLDSLMIKDMQLADLYAVTQEL